MEEILKQSGDSRKLAVSLKHLNYGDKLVDQLFEHSESMEQLYGLAQGLIGKGATKEESYKKCLTTFAAKTGGLSKLKLGYRMFTISGVSNVFMVYRPIHY